MSITRAIWLSKSQDFHSEVDDYISEAQLMRNDIVNTRYEAEGKVANSKWQKPDVFDEVSNALDAAERFLADWKEGKPAYRQKWEGILEDAQSWGGKNLRRIHGQICRLIRRLRERQAEAKQLRQLVEKTRHELSL